jgi:TMEM175 potassium channel family protein
MPNSSEYFETRRFETLSNTIFAVAMTLLSYRIPTAQFLNGPPVWSTMWAAYHEQIVALLLSFVVAGMFWFSHQRRLAYEPLASRSVVFLNLLFLLSIIALPITSGLFGTYGDAHDVVVLYCGHLSVTSGLNAILWLLASMPHGQSDRAIGSIFATVIFVAATLVAWVASTYMAKIILCGAFAAPVIDTIRQHADKIGRRVHRTKREKL